MTEVEAWLWHLFNDPMRDNPWSIVAFVVFMLMAIAGLAGLGAAERRIRQMFRRRKKETNVDDRQRAEGAISATRRETVAGRDPEGNPSGPGGYVESPQQRRERMEGEPPSPRPRTLADVEMLDVPGSSGSILATSVQDGFTVARTGSEDADQPMVFNPEVFNAAMAAAPDDTGTRMQASEIRALRPPCTHCIGKGYIMTTNDLLRESIALVGDGGDMVVKEFYTRLLAAAPALAQLFPPDLITAASGDELSAGYGQRNRLLGALVSLSQTYDTTDPEAMERLDTALNAFGARHAAFDRGDGTVAGASLEEYAAVKAVLFETLVAAAGPAWRPQYTVAWSEAYDYAAGVMLAAQRRSGAAFPRQPRA